MPKDKDQLKQRQAAKAKHAHEHAVARMEAAKALLDTQKVAGLAFGQTLMARSKTMLEQHRKRIAARRGVQP